MLMASVLAVIAGIVAGQFHHLVGAAPIVAAILCAGSFLRRHQMLIVGLGAILLRDLLVGFHWFTFVRVMAVLGVVGVAWLIRVGPNLRSLIMGLVLASGVYHIILASGDWALQVCSTFPRTPEGWVANLWSTLPYIHRTLVSDLAFSSIFLALYAFAGYLVSLWWPKALPQLVRD